jgi:hypothetical protein
MLDAGSAGWLMCNDRPTMKPMLKYFLIGFSLGVAIATLYLFCGDWDFGSPKAAWARVLLTPSIRVGFLLYDTCLKHMEDFNLAVSLCKVAGIVTMGLVFGWLACLLRLLLRLGACGKVHDAPQTI